MCAIIGIVSQTPLQDQGWIEAGRDAMHHRGPDDHGIWSSDDSRVVFGHRRLAIIDTSAAGHQPMQDVRKELCIVFNGEIYNYLDLRRELTDRGHTFLSNSDTEVILAAYREWGTDCLSRMNGAFAIALYDARKRMLFMARDRAGEKPLFYALLGGALRFSSELKGLMADADFPRRINYTALDCYLALGFVPGEHCMLDGVRKLPPAHALTFELESARCRIWRYWKLPAAPPLLSHHEESTLLDRLESLLDDAVQRQLIADVPVGVLLSGGVDSSLITAMAARARSNVKTFTIRFPGHGRFDETEHARLIARHFGTEHVELEADESSVDLLPTLARQFDEPMSDSSMIPTYLVSRLVRNHCTVALGGDGGDEMFGGYIHYNRLLWMQENLSAVPHLLRSITGRTANALLPVGVRGRKWLNWLASDFRRGLPLVAPSSFDLQARRSLMQQRTSWPLVAETVYGQIVPDTDDILQRATRTDFAAYLPEDILVKVDRASMLSSLELRAPLLDYRIIEFAYGSVPSQLKATPSTRKTLLKKLAARLLPPEFDINRKQGFTVPLGSWLREAPWQKFFRNVLLDSENSFFSTRATHRLLENQERGLENSERLFSLVLFELWRREYRVAT